MPIGRNINKISQVIKMHLVKKCSNSTHYETCPFLHFSGHFIVNMSFGNEMKWNPAFDVIHAVGDKAGRQPDWHTGLLKKKHVTTCS